MSELLPVPEEPDDWWRPEDIDEFIDAWRRLNLPEPAWIDVEGAHFGIALKLITDVEKWAKVLGLTVDYRQAAYIEFRRNGYDVVIGAWA